MDLTTLVIDKDDATERLREYEAQVLDERTAEDDAIRAGYRAAARGLPVISLSRAFATAGWFDDGLPRLAIVRADATLCRVELEWNRALVFDDLTDQWRRNRGALVGEHTVRVPIVGEQPAHRRFRGQTVVPTIPPRFRPRQRRLAHRHILWEVTAWDPTPPTDPALLRHIRGDLWAVEAVWDLTPLERAVLSQRARG